MVGVFDEVMEKEPNDDFHHPQALPNIPCTVNGAFNKEGDADNFSFHAEAGRWIVLALDGYGLGVQMDPMLRLLDENGVEVAMNHDTYNLDPLIAYQVKKSGTYTVEAMSFIHPPAAVVKLMGSADYVYRLTITDGPYARFVAPCAVQPGGSTEVKFVGWNFTPTMEEARSHKLPLLDPNSAAASGKVIHVPTPNGETVLAADTTRRSSRRSNPTTISPAPRKSRCPSPSQDGWALPKTKTVSAFPRRRERPSAFACMVPAFTVRSTRC